MSREGRYQATDARALWFCVEDGAVVPIEARDIHDRWHDDEGDLTFETFRDVNRARCTRWHAGFPEADTWSIADWSNAVCGEAGELANVVKKIRRHETGHKPGAKDPSLDELHAMAADEIGDVFAYLDLIATRLGLRLEDCAVRKFNRVSVREGHPERLPERQP